MGTGKSASASRTRRGTAAQAIAVPGDLGAAYDINEAGDVVGYVSSYEPDHSACLHRNGMTSMLAGLLGPWSM